MWMHNDKENFQQLLQITEHVSPSPISKIYYIFKKSNFKKYVWSCEFVSWIKVITMPLSQSLTLLSLILF